MSIRCAIGMKRENGEVAAIYCHNDGYPEGVGAILGRWYRNTKKVEALLKLGSISSLGAKLEPEAGAEHTIFNRQQDVTYAYHRDRKDPETCATVYPSVKSYRENAREDFWADFLYLFDHGKWLVFGSNGDWVEIKTEQ